jgi:hypothetical protein
MNNKTNNNEMIIGTIIPYRLTLNLSHKLFRKDFSASGCRAINGNRMYYVRDLKLLSREILYGRYYSSEINARIFKRSQ